MSPFTKREPTWADIYSTRRIRLCFCSKLQQLAVDLACTNDHADCLDTAESLYDLWEQSTAEENPWVFIAFSAQIYSTLYRVVVGLRPAFYCTSVRTGNRNRWSTIYDRYVEDVGTSNLPFDSVEKRNLLESLACSSNVGVLEGYNFKQTSLFWYSLSLIPTVT
jgi:aminopeptidase N